MACSDIGGFKGGASLLFSLSRRDQSYHYAQVAGTLAKGGGERAESTWREMPVVRGLHERYSRACPLQGLRIDAPLRGRVK
ncbi:MAG: hypothetical protein A3F75_13640 [Betaproteobacteria bacterium RIFCSPLOWO2_12_FULL_64_23]|nr:MAG: hypothetical protein A3F75_13640 [Betaproteobacteria bacterium RIFCSPLOWO2_12_FULL_64_23]